MGDPLSTTASIIAVIQLTGAVVGYIHSVASSTKARKTIASEAADTIRLLNEVRSRLEASDPQSNFHTAARQLAISGGPLDQYKAALEILGAPAHGLRKTKNALVRPFIPSSANINANVAATALKIEVLCIDGFILGLAFYQVGNRQCSS